MNDAHRGMLAAVLGTFAATLLALGITRVVLKWPPDAQGIASMVVLIVALFAVERIDGLWNATRRTGPRGAVNFVILFSAITATSLARAWLPTDWPVAVVGLVFPAFLLAHMALDWQRASRDSADASPGDIRGH